MSTYTNVPSSKEVLSLNPQLIKIEKGIPIAPTYRSTWAGQELPWEKLAIGDSFLIPVHDDDLKQVNAARNLVQAARNRFHDMKLVSRRVQGGVRVWRVKNIG